MSSNTRDLQTDDLVNTMWAAMNMDSLEEGDPVDLPQMRALTRENIYAGLTAAIEGGYFIVRQDNCADPMAPIGQCGCSQFRITEEWKP